jgi:hypothetical protein
VLSREAYRNRSPEEIALHRVATAEYGRRRGNRKQCLKQNWGLTIEQYEAMLDAQDRKCAVCGTADPSGVGNRSKRYFHVDHDHASGQIRQLLCGSCNVGLGHFRDDPMLMLAAVAYLRRHAQLRLSIAR